MSGVARYRKLPVGIEAVRFVGNNATEILRWADGAVEYEGGRILIPTLEGEMTASVGDWIIRGVKGEFYPCKPDIFEATYEPIEADEPFTSHSQLSTKPGP